MPVNDTIWPLEPHTAAKHAILRNYLNAWLPIMTKWNGRVIFLDGFAGPGKYEGGEPGSPIIALESALAHKQPINAEVGFIFIEARVDRHNYLLDLLDSQYKSRLPSNFSYQVQNAKFDETLQKILDYLEERQSRMAPTFAFIDPFGYSDTPFSIVERLMRHPRCEVLINFNFEELNRFLPVRSQWSHIDRQFGTDSWREAMEITEPQARQRLLHETYKGQLEHAAKIKYVRSFQMVNEGNRTDYFLFFGTNGYEGLRQMKHAMWRVDPIGAYRFSDRSVFNQPYLIEPAPDYVALKQLILHQFEGKGYFRIDELEKFVVVETPFLDTHYKRGVLRVMEDAGQLLVQDDSRKRRFTYPSGTRIRIN